MTVQFASPTMGSIQPSDLPSNAAPDLGHRDLREDEYWRGIPAYRELNADQFHDHRFQARNAVTSLAKLRVVVGDLVESSFWSDVEQGLRRSTMSMRVSPYILSLIDWRQPEIDPLRVQFIPLGSRFQPDHPELKLDSLNEQADSPVPGLTHRYRDRALFLALDTCPVYCRFCTRSYAVGLDTDDVEKLHFSAQPRRWDDIFAYIAGHPELEDIVISGGDMYNLRPEHIEHIGRSLLGIDHIRRLRYATKGPAVMPQKLLTDNDWVDSFTRVVELGRKQAKDVVLHTHFNHPNEITQITRAGLDRLAQRGIHMRNQAVLQRGVNDDIETMGALVRRLGYVNVHPYYIFLHDMVQGVEELRTPLQTAVVLEKQVRGMTSGFNMPAFVLDTMGGGGKRHVHSFEYYDSHHGIAVYTSPAVKPGMLFFYFDPIDTLDPAVQAAWAEPESRQSMLAAALEGARSSSLGR
ncbi:MAG: KamA family radical SAM protein [Candidatus Latescibacteria bacterium]|nr:KamA family radical SAM protein [Candidatus Latescibacterota bacterium]